ncbi:MAG TPA: type II toxin-antitoxin system MqsR family toxin [Candidatus Binataceae bacterium]|nr:type II toxin-antitoxin system MqsR family toxin [Candidatus Binataceae bacterium]
MPGRWLTSALRRIKNLAIARKVAFTLKALRELPELGLDEEDACEVLASLTTGDSAGRERSAATGEWMYVFKPEVAESVLYVKVILRSNCVLISFHEDEDEDGPHEENG